MNKRNGGGGCTSCEERRFLAQAHGQLSCGGSQQRSHCRCQPAKHMPGGALARSGHRRRAGGEGVVRCAASNCRHLPSARRSAMIAARRPVAREPRLGGALGRSRPRKSSHPGRPRRGPGAPGRATSVSGSGGQPRAPAGRLLSAGRCPREVAELFPAETAAPPLRAARRPVTCSIDVSDVYGPPPPPQTIHTHTKLDTCTPAHTHTRTHAHTHTQTRTHAHTHTQTHTYDTRTYTERWRDQNTRTPKPAHLRPRRARQRGCCSTGLAGPGAWVAWLGTGGAWQGGGTWRPGTCGGGLAGRESLGSSDSQPRAPAPGPRSAPAPPPSPAPPPAATPPCSPQRGAM